jgi:hypothetical protein
MTSLGFIILRHVSNLRHNNLYKLSYECVRRYYPNNHIIILDDNSDYNIIDKEYDDKLVNTTIIQSEYKSRGELLPYIYYLRHKLFDIAVILNDSVFINSNINLNLNENENYKVLWNFKHDWDNNHIETNLIKKLTNSDNLLEYYNQKHLWTGCFASMSIIRYNYLQKINEIHTLDNLIDYISNRDDRMAFERIIAVLLQFNDPNKFKLDFKDITLLCDIHQFISDHNIYWGLGYSEELKFGINNNLLSMPIIKCWNSR